MSCVYSNVYIGNCRQLYKFIRNNNLTYSLKIYYKVGGHYFLQPTPTHYKNITKTQTDKLIMDIRLSHTLPANF
jgi:hypothetical protein